MIFSYKSRKEHFTPELIKRKKHEEKEFIEEIENDSIDSDGMSIRWLQG